jgi:hypothetical protein
MTTELSPAVIEALSVGMLPDVQWKMHDDLCDCTYQRIGMWTNPYLADTLEVRMCCIWAEIYKAFPQFVRQVPAFWDYNTEEWVTEPAEWNGEDDMEVSMWHRQLARQTGKSLAEVREMGIEPPKGHKKQAKPVFLLPWSGEYVAVELGR